MAAGVLLEAVAVEVVAGAVSWGSLGYLLGSSWTLLCSLGLAEGIIWSSGALQELFMGSSGFSGAISGLSQYSMGEERRPSCVPSSCLEVFLSSLGASSSSRQTFKSSRWVLWELSQASVRVISGLSWALLNLL